MKTSKFSETQIVAILKQQEAGLGRCAKAAGLPGIDRGRGYVTL